MNAFEPYTRTKEEIAQEISSILSGNDVIRGSREAYCSLLSMVDLTSLEGSDTDARIISICEKARSFHLMGSHIPDVAAVCFYPPFIALARHELRDTGIRVATVAGAFPSGQSPLSAKLEEVKFAVESGADEIDTVISRGKLLEGDLAFVHDEIAAIRAACGKTHLKVILETGELHAVEHIRRGSQVAIEAGADFIKTSTGKVQPAATLEAFFIMAETVREYAQKTGKKVGIKPAGGISTADEALKYLNVLKAVLGPKWVDRDLFRIGASRLTDDLVKHILP
jgi:deoxyribose-phosphate aldolase